MAVARGFAERTQPRYSVPQSAIGISFATDNPSQSQFRSKSKIKISSRFLGSESRWNALVGYQLQANNRHRIKSSFPRSTSVVARLFGPAIFQASKLKVLFLGTHEEKHPGNLSRTYTLTHSDLTAKLTLAISQTINKDQLQGWYNRLQRDEVIAQWKKSQGKMSLHVHCHIIGGHWLLDAIARLRFYIFRKELPMVLEAFRHGEEKHPEVETALVWVYFHSNVREFNRVECWDSLAEACQEDLTYKVIKDSNGRNIFCCLPSECNGLRRTKCCTFNKHREEVHSWAPIKLHVGAPRGHNYKLRSATKLEKDRKRKNYDIEYRFKKNMKVVETAATRKEIKKAGVKCVQELSAHALERVRILVSEYDAHSKEKKYALKKVVRKKMIQNKDWSMLRKIFNESPPVPI